MDNKEQVREAERFLGSLKDGELLYTLISDRVGIDLLVLINDYASRMEAIKEKILKDHPNMKTVDMTSSAITVGYLLRSHLERYGLSRLTSYGED